MSKKCPHKQAAKELGLIKYKDGRECKNGHCGYRYTRNGACVDCAKDQANTESAKKNRGNWRKRNPEKVKESVRKYKVKNQDYQKKYAEKNRERLESYWREYALKNKEKKRANTKKWAKENPEKAKINARISQANRRFRKEKAMPVWADKEVIKDIYKNCPDGFHVDHIIPLANKKVCGLHVPNNLQYLTADENRQKSNRFNEVSRVTINPNMIQ